MEVIEQAKILRVVDNSPGAGLTMRGLKDYKLANNNPE